jgi:hypothetical protein
VSSRPFQFGSRALFLVTAVSAVVASAWAAGVFVPVALVVGAVLLLFALLYHLARPPDATIGARRPNAASPTAPVSAPAVLATVAGLALVMTLNVLLVRVGDVGTAWSNSAMFAIGWTLAASACGGRLMRDRNTVFQIALCVLAICCAAANIGLSILLMYVE